MYVNLKDFKDNMLVMGKEGLVKVGTNDTVEEFICPQDAVVQMRKNAVESELAKGTFTTRWVVSIMAGGTPMCFGFDSKDGDKGAYKLFDQFTRR